MPVPVVMVVGSSGVQGDDEPGGQSQLSLPINKPGPVPGAQAPPGTPDNTLLHAFGEELYRKLVPLTGPSGDANFTRSNRFRMVLGVGLQLSPVVVVIPVVGSVYWH